MSSKYKKKLSTHVPPVLLYNVESKVHGHNFIRHFFALISMFSFKTRSPFIISLTCELDQSEESNTTTVTASTLREC